MKFQKMSIANTKDGIIKKGMEIARVMEVNSMFNDFIAKVREDEYFTTEKDTRKFLTIDNIKKLGFKDLGINLTLEIVNNDMIPTISAMYRGLTVEDILFGKGIANIYEDTISGDIELSFEREGDRLILETKNNMLIIDKERADFRHVEKRYLYKFVSRHHGIFVILSEYFTTELLWLVKKWKKATWNSNAKENYKQMKTKLNAYERRQLKKSELLDLLKQFGEKTHFTLLKAYLGEEIEIEKVKELSGIIKRWLAEYDVFQFNDYTGLLREYVKKITGLPAEAYKFYEEAIYSAR